MTKETLRQQSPTIDIQPETFRKLGHRLIDQIANFMAEMPTGSVTRGEEPEKVREALGADNILPEEGTDPEQLLNKAFDLLSNHSLFNGHPRFWGYITSSPAPIGVLGDLLASAMNPNAGAWVLSPMATEIERQTVQWISDFMGYPGEGGLMVSGGNMANFVSFLAAMRAKTGPDIRTHGMSSLNKRLVFYCSRETHTWVQKAADLFGLGSNSIRWIHTDTEYRMDLHHLTEMIDADTAAALEPFLIIGNGGSVSTGVIDPLDAIAKICQENKLWFHIDGAYGGVAAGLPEYKDHFKGIEKADSVAVDPHKWLYSPLEAGCTLIKDPKHLQSTFSYHPDYYNFDMEKVNYFDYSLQNSRGFKALKVWLTLNQLGRKGFIQTIGEDIELARYAFFLMEKQADIEPFSWHMSITTFRYVPLDLKESSKHMENRAYLNELNKQLLAGIEQEGKMFLSNAVIDDIFLLRMCIVNFRTLAADIHFLVDTVSNMGQRLDHRMRGKKKEL